MVDTGGDITGVGAAGLYTAVVGVFCAAKADAAGSGVVGVVAACSALTSDGGRAFGRDGGSAYLLV